MRYSIMIFLTLAGGTVAGCGQPQWDLPSMDGLDAERWGPRCTDGPEAYRTVKSGKSAKWKVPVWWGDSARPPKGTVYVLSLRYKDTISSPAVFCAHAGLAPYWRHSEIHRFGGLADGTWKTAQLPVSWDLICRIKGEDNTAFSIRSPGDLPVGMVTVRLAGTGDAERFFLECREQVARMDAKEAGEVAAAEFKTPVIPEALRADALVPFVRAYYSPIFEHSAPAAGESGAAIRVRMTEDEFEPAAFGVYANGRKLKDVTCSISRLTGPGGDFRGQVELRTVEYALARTFVARRQTALKSVPMRLWPSFPVDVPAGRSHGFWMTVRTEAGRTRPGVYKGAVTIRSDGESAELPLEVEVLPLRLLSIDEAGIAMGACINSLLPEQEMRTFQEHNLRTAQSRFHSTYLPLERIADGYEVDFGYADEWMEMAKAHGLKYFRYLMGGNPYGHPATMTLEKHLFTHSVGAGDESEFIARHKPHRQKPEAAGILPAIRPAYRMWVAKTVEHAKKQGWPKLVVEPFDEPAKWVHDFVFPNSPEGCIGSGRWIKWQFLDGVRLIREASPDACVSVTVHHAKPGMPFIESPDLVSTNAIHEDLKLGEKIVGAGKVFWQYTGCNATQPAGIPRYTCGFYFGAFGSVGGVTWAMNWSKGFDHYGQNHWAYSWYTPFGTITSPAYEGLREGLDDRRLIETCRKRFAGHPESKALLKSILVEAVANRAKSGTDTVNDFYNSPEEVAKLDTWRDRLLDELMKIGERR